MSYVPPHLRNRKEQKQPAKEIKIVDSEFPKFASEHKPTDFKGPSFVSKIKEESKPVVSEYKEITIPRTRSRYSYFERKNKYDEYGNESDSELEPEVIPNITTNPEEDGWQTVERKVRVKKDKVQDALDHEDAPLEEEEESAWNEQPEEYETYWDERKH
jgi:hypothetical protein